MFTQRHYEVIADMLAEADTHTKPSGKFSFLTGQEAVWEMIHAFTVVFAEDNERFSPKLFWRRATGLDDVQIMYAMKETMKDFGTE